MSDSQTPEQQADKFLMDPGGTVVSQCLTCRHFRPGTFGAVCRAFPGGIPYDVLGNLVDHRRPHPLGQEDWSVVHAPRADVPGVAIRNLYSVLDALGKTTHA